MKTIEIEITTNATRKVALELPVYFRINDVYFTIAEPNKVVRVDTYQSMESINVFNYPESHFKEDAKIITESEFTEQFNKVTNIINEILK